MGRQEYIHHRLRRAFVMLLTNQVFFDPGENPAFGGRAARSGGCIGQIASEVMT